MTTQITDGVRATGTPIGEAALDPPHDIAEVASAGGTLRWYHGVASVGAITTSALSAGLLYYTLGTWGVVVVYGVCALVAFLQNKLFAEMAGMFPSKEGGITLYASEVFRGKGRFVSAIAIFGYWMGYAFAVGFAGSSMSAIIQMAWWHEMPEWDFIGLKVTAGTLIAVGSVLVVGFFAYLGPTVFAPINMVVSGALGAITVLCMIAPLFHLDDLKFSDAKYLATDWKGFVVAFYVTAFTVYATELVATMAPAFRDVVNDTKKALRVAALLTLVFATVIPLSCTAVLGEDMIIENPLNYPSLIVASIFGGSAVVVNIVNVVMVLFTFNIMLIILSGSSQALCAMAEEGLMVRQVGRRTRSGIPVVALAVSIVLNSTIALLIEDPLAVLIACNIGYVVAVCIVIASYLALRHRGQPTAKGLAVRFGMPLAAVLLAINVFALACGMAFPEYAGGGGAEVVLGVVVLLLGACGFGVRLLQDRAGAKAAEGIDLAEPEQRESAIS